MNKIFKSLKSVLTLHVIVIATLPLLAISFFTLQLLDEKISRQIMERNHVVADSLAAETASFMLTARRAAQQAVEGAVYIGLDKPVMLQDYLGVIIKYFPAFEYFQIVNHEGTVVMMIPADEDYIGNDISKTSYFRRAAAIEGPVRSAVFISPMTGYPTVIMVHPLGKGMLVTALNLSSLSNVMARAAMLQDGWAGVTDSEGTYVAHAVYNEVEQRTNIRELLSSSDFEWGQDGNFQTEYGGQKVLLSVVKMPEFDLTVIVGQKTSAALASLLTARRIFACGAVLTLLAALFIAWRLRQKIIVPITGLVENIKRVATGQYQVRPEHENYEELVVLSGEFAKMAAAVVQREQALLDKQQEMELFLRQLEQSNRELDQFAYVTSHDLKAPLRAIMNLSQWLEEDLAELATPNVKAQLALLRSRAQRMENLIIGILEYSRIGKGQQEMEAVEVAALLQEIQGEINFPAGFKLETAKNLPVLWGNRTQLWQVFANLISNAVKHHQQPQCGHIWIEASEEEGFYRIWVRDNGPGIDKIYHKKIFQIFQTLKPRDQFESTGVGLALVQKIVQQQGGDIYLESKAGEGAIFSFTWKK